MAVVTSSSLASVLATSIALIDQFLTSIETSSDNVQSNSIDHPSTVHLITASAKSLKSSVTRLSLLTITSPFTPSAILSTLQPVNESILPSLATAALLTTPAIYPEVFAKECRTLTVDTLKDFKSLAGLIKKRAEDGKPKTNLSEARKKEVTEATGRVWEDCDVLTNFASDDVAGLAVKKAQQWLDLMKDAVKELEEWDPEEDDIDDQDWLGQDEANSDEDEEADTKKDDEERATINAGVKDQAMKVLSRIPQSVHVVVKQRLEKLPRPVQTNINEPMKPMDKRQRDTINLILSKTRTISDCIDESAEGMYLGDLEKCLKKAGEARALTIEVVESVLEPWTASTDQADSKEDLYIKRALQWIQQVDTGVVDNNNKGKEKT